MAIAPVPVSPATAARAYQATDTSAAKPAGTGGGFSNVLARTLEGAVAAGHQADAQSATAIAGGGNITDVVTAVSKAELALQTTVAIRDRVVQAYQDIMRMPI
jgi:flagellar hook-basal body complex protein FliE